MDRKFVIVTCSILFVVTIVFIGLYLFTPSILDKWDYSPLEIELDKEDIKTNELFNVTLKNDIKGANISWDFGDGIPLYGKIVQYSFSESNHHDIEVTVLTDDYHRTLHTGINVYNRDETISWNIGPRQNLRPLSTVNTGWNQYIYPGLSEPEISFSIDLKEVVGNYVIWIYIRDNESGEKTDLIRESFTWNNQDIHLDYSFGSEDLPDIDQVFYYQCQIEMEIGKWSDMEQTSSVKY